MVSVELSRREVAASAALGLVLSFLMAWPLPLHLGSEIGKDLGDPLFQAWQIAWIGHALIDQPLDLWQANTFWPYDDTLAFSDALIGYAPAGLVAQLSPYAALVVYNALFLGAYALAYVGAYLLARELGIGRAGAVAAGAAFAYAPWKLTQNGHLHVLSSGGIPLALFLLLRGYRRRSPGLVLSGWLVAAWQVTLGFALGLQLLYLLLALGLGVAALLARGALVRPDRRITAATALGVAALALTSALMARPHLRVLDAHPEARRTAAYVATYSPRLESFLAVPEESRLWSRWTARARASLPEPDEMSLFPGLSIAALALIGAIGGVLSRRQRVVLVAGVAVCAALSLGVRDVSGPTKYLMPYRVLFDFAPGWDGLRTPGRVNTLTSLGLALLAGAGLCVVVRTVRSRRHGAIVGVVGSVLVVSAILAEGLGPLGHPSVPAPPAAVRHEPAPHLHLPAGSTNDDVYSYWSTQGFPASVNGAGGFVPTPYGRLLDEVAGFPDERSVAALRSVGVRTVFVHPDRTAGTPWEGAARKPIRGLRLARETVDGVLVFRIN